LLIYGVIGWFLGAVAWRTCGRVCAASGMGATTQRKKLAYNGLQLCVCLPLTQGFNLTTNLMGQIAQNRCYLLVRLFSRILI